MKLKDKSPAEQAAIVMQKIYDMGLTTTSGGNISVKDDKGDIWITPGGKDKGSLDPADMVKISANGDIQGNFKPSVELPIHKMIYDARPEVGAVVHAHPRASAAFAIANKLPRASLLPTAYKLGENCVIAEYKTPGTDELGYAVSEKFRDGADVVLMQNHGLIAVGTDIGEAFARFEHFEYLAKLEIAASRIGQAHALSEQDIKNAVYSLNTTDKKPADGKSATEIKAIMKRAADHGLITSAQGVFSSRTHSGFVMNDYSKYSISAEHRDVLSVENTHLTRDVTAGNFASLLGAIYEKNSDINSVVFAQPESVMAFATAHKKFETRYLSESFIMLNDIASVPFDEYIANPAIIAELFLAGSLVVIVENMMIAAVGESLLKAYDRLEVAEQSARSVLSATELGGRNMLTQEQTDDIKKVFNL